MVNDSILCNQILYDKISNKCTIVNEHNINTPLEGVLQLLIYKYIFYATLLMTITKQTEI